MNHRFPHIERGRPSSSTPFRGWRFFSVKSLAFACCWVCEIYPTELAIDNRSRMASSTGTKRARKLFAYTAVSLGVSPFLASAVLGFSKHETINQTAYQAMELRDADPDEFDRSLDAVWQALQLGLAIEEEMIAALNTQEPLRATKLVEVEAYQLWDQAAEMMHALFLESAKAYSKKLRAPTELNPK